MRYTIGSLNTRHFTGVGKHDINQMANVILSERFDIIALQEVKRVQAVEYLLSRLPGWKGGFGQPGRSGAAALGYAFLWDDERVSECSKDGEPGIFRNYRSHVRMTRDPFYGRFTSVGKNGAFFEIRLINVHLCWSNEGVYDYFKRLQEFELVTNNIYQMVSKGCFGTNMPAFTVVLGDYNLTLDECTQFDCAAQTKQSEKTTIGKWRYANDFDHFSYSEKRFAGISMACSRVDSVHKYMGGNFDLHIERISDHAPVKLEITF